MSQELSFKDLVSRTKLGILKYPAATFFGMFALRVKVTQNPEIPTLRTNGMEIQINEDFFSSLTPAEQVGVFFHEILHIALGHSFRIQNRDTNIWNIACDHAVNNLVTKYGMILPAGAHLDKNLAHLSADDIYEAIFEESTKNEDKPQYDDVAPPSNSGSNSGDSGNNSGNQESNSPPFTEDDLHEALSDVRTAMEMAGKDIGQLPGDIQRLFDKYEKPVLDWKSILRRFLNQAARNKYLWTRPNRRYSDVYMPSRRGNGLNRVDFLIDVSGSISQQEFKAFLSEVQSVLTQFKPEQIGVSQFDCGHLGTDVLTKYQSIQDVSFKGGGGTYIKESIEKLRNQPTKAIIVLTDGYIFDLENTPEPPVPIIWCVYDNKDFKAPYGKTVHFDLNKLLSKHHA